MLRKSSRKRLVVCLAVKSLVSIRLECDHVEAGDTSLGEHVKWIRSRFLGCLRLQRCWCAMRWRITAGGLSSASLWHAHWDRSTGFCKGPGRLDWLRLSGASSPCAVGGYERTRKVNPRKN